MYPGNNHALAHTLTVSHGLIVFSIENSFSNPKKLDILPVIAISCPILPLFFMRKPRFKLFDASTVACTLALVEYAPHGLFTISILFLILPPEPTNKFIGNTLRTTKFNIQPIQVAYNFSVV
ncbi:MAG: hypothetical protein WCL18_09190 [bacterium]